MILRFYRTNQTIVLLSLPLVAALLWSVHWYFPLALDYKTVQSWIPYSPSWPLWSFLLIQALLAVLEALLFNRILNDLELFDRISYVPALTYLVLAFLLVPNGLFQGISLSNFFILQAFHTLMLSYRENSAKPEAFLSGLMLGVAFLFSWVILPLLFCAWIALNTLKTFYWREWFLLALGFVLPVCFFQMIYFGINAQWVLIDWSPGEFAFSFFPLGSDRSSRVFWILLLVLVFIALFSFLNRFRGTINRVRKQRQALLYLSFFLMAVFVACNGFFQGNGTVFLVIPFSLFLSFLLVHSALQWLSDLLFYSVVLLFLLSRIMPV